MSKKSLIKRVSVGFAGWVSMKWITRDSIYLPEADKLLKEAFQKAFGAAPITSIR